MFVIWDFALRQTHCIVYFCDYKMDGTYDFVERFLFFYGVRNKSGNRFVGLPLYIEVVEDDVVPNSYPLVATKLFLGNGRAFH